MAHRSGGKYAGSHSTLMNSATTIADFLERNGDIRRISLGLIRNHSGGGGARVLKMLDDTGCVLLVVSQGGSVQQIRIYSDNSQKVKDGLAKYARGIGWKVRFGSRI
ncbi:hypothetical protein A3F07_03170 [candidate division WWE3 bacterium RIFCSPHIGHO2_12_FULL_38_15]|uniref:Uncharacterized protein n=1 Tax=candidate division WWE3 bacterium RIFCSPHIGHO2_02_FULL_38_14 TaxID=1802620 RepID=A0A1F4VB57_UNCKA|nr:MAG: hypothetical protein A2793_04180 [candidate division WWE3 bacterium RIFCSPHIGHO2_01_FULL_38_45]OGC49470.1 MAG: hypothetical protein A3F07_03170 [candidate division WWE3 bacterium RIFCSPHIGHO2_12_FULL_38_15]OGC52719.1 MAG: hypothetical protein A3B64_00905 [candidate division WWE3 bacterium RIFCSPLOWO2_01_FULL_37_24]OGC53913.1 MAG: hypothetical protein A3D91_03960 [candidate division WWE3 bacterium RIFCSPHIGHO2_02_FULL_38_14]HLB52078.1 DUF2103 domain-containing protein [Patescibacteria gr